MYTNEYDEALSRMQARFSFNLKNGTEPLFTTDVPDLWDTYLDSFGAGPLRQYHTCHACRQFIERYGNLVTIDSSGITRSPLWHENDAVYIYKPAFAALANRVRRAKVTGVFLSSDKVWGTPVTGIWNHFALTPPRAILHGHAGTLQATLTAEQAMAEKREDYKAVMRALTEFMLPHLELALTLLKTDSLYRSEKVLGQAEWLHNLHVARAAAFGSPKAKSNIVWRAVATAPAGFCHPRSSMIGSLLEDIAAGLEYEHVRQRFAAKMHPLSYQRPQAAPKAGAIQAAERALQQLGAAGSLTHTQTALSLLAQHSATYVDCEVVILR